MSECQQRLLSQIECAFAGVQLGEGVSLHETQVLDDYGSEEERRAAREPDEKNDWRKLIDHPSLTVIFALGYGGLCFLDDLGMRFHLPACLYRIVRDFHIGGIDGLLESLSYRLTDFSDSNRQLLAIFNDDQRHCIHDFWLFICDSSEYDFETFKPAIEGYWSRWAEYGTIPQEEP